MRLTIAVRDAQGKLYNLPDRYEFSPDELNRLIDDFNAYCTADSNSP